METLNPYTIYKTENVGYEITPFDRKLIGKENQTGCFWQLRPGESTWIQILTDNDYKIHTEAVNGIGYFLRQLPDDRLDIQLASPKLGNLNPKIISGKDTIVCWISCPDQRTLFVVEGVDLGKTYSPEYEREIFQGRDRVQILIQGSRARNLAKFWQAHHILKTQTLNFTALIYPELRQRYNAIKGNNEDY